MRKDFAQRQTSLVFHVHPTWDELPQRLDQHLGTRIPGRSRSSLKKVFKENRVLVDGRPSPPSRLLRGDEIIEVLLDMEENYTLPENIPLDIIFEDERILAVNKRPGVVMHPAGQTRSGTLLNAIHHHYEKQDSPLRPVLLQRLDKDTSGLVLLAKDDDAHAILHKSLSRHSMDKIYLAICQGRPAPENGCWDAYIGQIAFDGPKKMGILPPPDGVPALTLYTTLAHLPQGRSLLGIRLCTGRQHQIRLHATHAGHPLIGDTHYNGDPSFSRQALHAYYMRFTHPQSGEAMSLAAPLTEDLLPLLSHAEVLDAHKTCWLGGQQPWDPQPWIDSLDPSLLSNDAIRERLARKC